MHHFAHFASFFDVSSGGHMMHVHSYIQIRPGAGIEVSPETTRDHAARRSK
jgi:hypothetical protein